MQAVEDRLQVGAAAGGENDDAKGWLLAAYLKF
jgi:hypothetical protein